MSDTLVVLSKLIDTISEEYLYFSQKFIQKVNMSKYNLRKLNIGNIMRDDYFLHELIPGYLKFSAILMEKIEYDFLDYLLDFDFSYRVKSQKTTYDKIRQYSYREKSLGGISVNKSLNDLVGFRIILADIEKNLDGIRDLLTLKCDDKKLFRFIDCDVGGYHAIHCYFKINNYSFPWELQIWDSANKADNFFAHEEHERKRMVESNASYDRFS